MKENRTEQISLRVTPEMKHALEVEANICDWTLGGLVYRILKDWLKNSGGALSLILED